MKTIIWDLPKDQIGYLKKNCEKEFEKGTICVMEPDTAKKMWEQIAEGMISPKELLLISENPGILADGIKSGWATIGYERPKADKLQEEGAKEPLPRTNILVEGFEEVDYDFLEKIYQRHHGIPWTILQTEHLFVRELALTDMENLFELYSYKGMTDYMEGLYSYEEEYEYQKSYIANMYGFFGYGMWLVFEKESGKLVGRAGVEHREELNGELELGYAIGTPWQGKGYATEVCRAIIDYVREELGFEEICSLTEPKNVSSLRVLEKLDFQFEEEIVLENIHYKKLKKRLKR